MCMCIYVVHSPAAHVHYALLLETAGSIEAAESVLNMAISSSPEGCGNRDVSTYFALVDFQRRIGKMDNCIECLDRAFRVFEKLALKCEMHAILIKKTEVIMNNHPENALAAWKCLIDYRSIDSVFQCDSDLPLMRAAYQIALKLLANREEGVVSESTVR